MIMILAKQETDSIALNQKTINPSRLRLCKYRQNKHRRAGKKGDSNKIRNPIVDLKSLMCTVPCNNVSPMRIQPAVQGAAEISTGGEGPFVGSDAIRQSERVWVKRRFCKVNFSSSSTIGNNWDSKGERNNKYGLDRK